MGIVSNGKFDYKKYSQSFKLLYLLKLPWSCETIPQRANYIFLINRIMASLNLLRYLVIKDNENDNQVSELFEKETVQNA
jgi:hypothetical protein